jgi:hypothetical protein
LWDLQHASRHIFTGYHNTRLPLFRVHNFGATLEPRYIFRAGALANILAVYALPQRFPLSVVFGTLVGGLGSFPLDRESSHSQSVSRPNCTGIRSLIGFGNLVRPLAHSVLYPL